MPAAPMSHPPPRRVPVGFALGFAIFGAPTAWFLQLIINYTLASRTCYPDGVPLAQPILGFVWWVLIGVDCLAIITAALAGFIALGNWRRRREAWAAHSLAVGERRNRFLTMWAMMTTALFSIALIFTIVMLFIVPVCDV